MCPSIFLLKMSKPSVTDRSGKAHFSVPIKA
jgi:hypothetical protein